MSKKYFSFILWFIDCRYALKKRIFVVWNLTMKWSYKIFRAILVSLLTLMILIPTTLYVVMTLPPVQNKVKEISEKELRKLLNTNVEIGSVIFTPFNRVTLRNIVIEDTKGDTAAYIKRLGAGINLRELINNQNIEINYTELIGLDARISKETPDAPLNIQPIIDALKPKEKNKPPTLFNLKINTVVVRNTQLKYDIIAAEKDSMKLDFNHLHIYDFNADLKLPRIKNDDFSIDIKRFTLKEKSGIELKSLKGAFHIASYETAIKGLELHMPNSEIYISDITVNYTDWNDLKQNYCSIPLNFSIIPGSYISPRDLKGLLPQLGKFNNKIDLELFASGKVDDIQLKKLDISIDNDKMWLLCRGKIQNITDKENATIDFPRINLHGYGQDIATIVSYVSNISQKDKQTLSNLGKTAINITAKGSLKKAILNGLISTSPGNAKIDITYNKSHNNSPIKLAGKVSTENFNIGQLISNQQLGNIGLKTEFNASIANSKINGSFLGDISHLQFKNYTYQGIKTFFDLEDKKINGSLIINDSNIDMVMAGEALLNEKAPLLDLHIDANDISLYNLNLLNKYPEHHLSATVHAEYNGTNINDAIASLSVNGLKFITPSQEGINIENINIELNNQNTPQHITLNSDIIDGEVEGCYDFASLTHSAKDIISHYLPSLISAECIEKTINEKETEILNDFNINFTIKDNNEILDFINAPVRLIHPIKITGGMNHIAHKMNLEIDAPYLQQKNKLVKNTHLSVNIDKNNNLCQFHGTTIMPTKKGETLVNLKCNGLNDRIDTKIDWDINNTRAFNGNIMFSSLFQRNEDNTLFTNINIHPSELVFNDTAWTVNPAHIVVNKDITVSGFDAYRDNQYIKINGKASANPDDQICLELLDVNLDYIFETLAINNVAFGGNATGTFYASNLFSKEPRLSTPGLKVDKLSYNYSVLGDAIIESHWDADNKGVAINADISQSNGCKSYINGAIFPMNDSLDLKFKTQKINVGFMQPFMSAFAKDVSGYASGNARLWGKFKTIDMTGDIYAEDLRLKIDFTNTYYTTSDSIHLKPGYIGFKDVKLTDAYGNNALLGGYLKHTCFKRPEFEFNITKARNFLSYDETPERNPIWHGRIFGNGEASVKGKPGEVNIMVDMTTAPKSTFTFVLSDQLEANEYTFITFRDRDKLNGVNITPVDSSLIKVRELEERIAQAQMQSTSATKYTLDIQVDATPEAEMILVMDPIGGDRIKARGDGELHLIYDSDNENDIFLSGKYMIEEGKYNFTLQDIIVKEFIINNESSITFNGDPYAAILDVEAAYALNANLTDLDESFAEDKDLARTNIPVHAIILVNGDMRQPSIDFKLRFPSLTDNNVENKVNSIISTKDMMNRQIIYLLALNRFYTPEYMSSTTKGNELASVASSTISSQLSSMLGELSDNWSISPNFRSDKGDFSDVEVDLALSSRLLNNRLLFNGNFGYRDKTMNDNTFVGDFDIEYLLNRGGNIRLKAYNRYNDQNYYLKSATTTQGVGIVFRRDFDKMFNFLNIKKDKPSDNSNDSIAPADSINRKIQPVIIPERK